VGDEHHDVRHTLLDQPSDSHLHEIFTAFP
jgi:hypothetical protein